MATADRGFASTLEQAEMALAAMHTGNSEPYIACWEGGGRHAVWDVGPDREGLSAPGRDISLGRAALPGWARGRRTRRRLRERRAGPYHRL
jgi:hypothetical protein